MASLLRKQPSTATIVSLAAACAVIFDFVGAGLSATIGLQLDTPVGFRLHSGVSPPRDPL